MNPIGSHGYKTFDQMKVSERDAVWDERRSCRCSRLGDRLPASVSHLLVGEIRRIDDESISLPMAARVAVPLPDVVFQVWPPVEWNNPGVESFTNHHDPPGRLHDQHGAVVVHRTLRRVNRNAA